MPIQTAEKELPPVRVMVGTVQDAFTPVTTCWGFCRSETITYPAQFVELRTWIVAGIGVGAIVGVALDVGVGVGDGVGLKVGYGDGVGDGLPVNEGAIEGVITGESVDVTVTVGAGGDNGHKCRRRNSFKSLRWCSRKRRRSFWIIRQQPPFNYVVSPEGKRQWLKQLI